MHQTKATAEQQPNTVVTHFVLTSRSAKSALVCTSFSKDISCCFVVTCRCLLKWLEIRSVCPMCNKPIMRLHNADAPRGTEGVQDPEEV